MLPAMSALAHALDLLRGRRVAVLTGAGCSTESGIPDYRGPGTAARARAPLEHRQFVGDPAARARYWARSVVGWPRIRATTPNAGHRALAELERAGVVARLVTQNVDSLHTRAGSRDVVELHGALARVQCLGCGEISARDALQARILAANPGFSDDGAAATTPDGDAAVERDLGGFVVPACEACDGVLMPDVVFFGGVVPRARVAACEAAVDAADALLVVGSSLAVFSGLRVVRHARKAGRPCVLVNLGPAMRGMEHFDAHVDARAGEALPALAAALIPTAPVRAAGSAR
ncbi:MAG: NAD-dependent protein deacetylase [Deltaproteobacteria bacterium]|nr:NAD-dependent protein deacetylase [Deltaproteobacteria bacterium]